MDTGNERETKGTGKKNSYEVKNKFVSKRT